MVDQVKTIVRENPWKTATTLLAALCVALIVRTVEIGGFHEQVAMFDDARSRHEKLPAHPWAMDAIQRIQTQYVRDSIWRAGVDRKLDAIGKEVGVPPLKMQGG